MDTVLQPALVAKQEDKDRDSNSFQEQVLVDSAEEKTMKMVEFEVEVEGIGSMQVEKTLMRWNSFLVAFEDDEYPFKSVK